MSIFQNFEGYKQAEDSELLDAVRRFPVILDANVMLDLYSYDEPARHSAVALFGSVENRLWVPHQAMREFWRNRPRAILDSGGNEVPLDGVKAELLSILNRLSPNRAKTAAVENAKREIENQFDSLQGLVGSLRGERISIDAALRSTSEDPVVAALERVLDRKVGDPFEPAELEEMVKEGHRRFALQIPPGYEDENKSGLPELGTGDFLLWEQTLRFVEAARPQPSGFVLVTGDSKKDWRLQHPSRKQALGVRPELVSEALQRTGARFFLMTPSEFYRIAARAESVDADSAESLLTASTRTQQEREREAVDGPLWTFAAYTELLGRLRGLSRLDQTVAIEEAARNGAFVDRSRVYELCGYDEDRSLKRFSLPAQRIMLDLQDEGLVDLAATSPLTAEYDGPGKAVGFSVPKEFMSYVGTSET